MKGNHYNPEAANAGGGTSNVPFYELVAPHLYDCIAPADQVCEAWLDGPIEMVYY